MQDHVRYLVAEDIKKWSHAISTALKHYFLDRIGMSDERVRGSSAYDGDQANQQLTAGMFDLLTLDMNLGEGMSGSKISGRDLLQQIAALQGDRGAYFIIIITGAIHEGSQLEALYGRETAARMRYGAYNDAVQQIPAERVRIIHKPNSQDVAEAMKELLPHLHSALDQYSAVSCERNIFRPRKGGEAKTKKRIWEFRYNGGLRRTIPEIPGFEMYRSALARPNLEMRIVALMNVIAQSSGTRPIRASSVSDETHLKAEAEKERQEDPQQSFIIGGEDPRSRGALGLDYTDRQALTIYSGVPVDTTFSENDITPESIILGLLDVSKKGGDLKQLISNVASNLVPIAQVRMVPRKIAFYLEKRHHLAAKNEFNDDQILERLEKLYREVVPIIQDLSTAEANQTRTQPSDPPKTAERKARLNLGTDTKQMEKARQWRIRVLEELKRYELYELADHLEKHMNRGLRAKGRLTYRYEDGFPPFWLTQ